MKYFDTLIEDQETTISILYQEQIIRIYSSTPTTIQKLIKLLGQPTVKYKKSKTYWSGASWDIGFFEFDKLKEILYRDTFIDKKLKPILKEEKKNVNKIKKDKLPKVEKIKNEKEKKLKIKEKKVNEGKNDLSKSIKIKTEKNDLSKSTKPKTKKVDSKKSAKLETEKSDSTKLKSRETKIKQKVNKNDDIQKKSVDLKSSKKKRVFEDKFEQIEFIF